MSVLILAFYLLYFMFFLWLCLQALFSGPDYTLGISGDINKCCGNIFNRSGSCADPSHELVCDNNETVLYLYYGRHQLQAIVAGNSSVRSVLAGIDNNDCSSITDRSIAHNNFDGKFPQDMTNIKADSLIPHDEIIIFVSCKNPVSSPEYVDIAAPCGSRTARIQYHSYVVRARHTGVSEVPELCSIDMMLRVVSSRGITCNKKCPNGDKIKTEQMKGLELRWQPNRCAEWQPPRDSGDCWFDHPINLVLCHDSTSFSWRPVRTRNFLQNRRYFRVRTC